MTCKQSTALSYLWKNVKKSPFHVSLLKFVLKWFTMKYNIFKAVISCASSQSPCILSIQTKWQYYKTYTDRLYRSVVSLRQYYKVLLGHDTNKLNILQNICWLSADDRFSPNQFSVLLLMTWPNVTSVTHTPTSLLSL